MSYGAKKCCKYFEKTISRLKNIWWFYILLRTNATLNWLRNCWQIIFFSVKAQCSEPCGMSSLVQANSTLNWMRNSILCYPCLVQTQHLNWLRSKYVFFLSNCKVHKYSDVSIISHLTFKMYIYVWYCPSSSLSV